MCRLYGKFASYFSSYKWPWFPLSVLVLIDSLVVTRVVMQFPAKIPSSCIWVVIPIDWVILYWYAGGEDGRSLARCTVTWLPNFLGWVDLLIHGAPLARARAPIYIGHYKTNTKLFVTMDWWQCCDPKRRKLLPHLWQEILLPHTTERETKKSRRKISSGSKESQFYSQPLGQAGASMY